VLGLIRTNFHHNRRNCSRSQHTTLSYHSCLYTPRSSTELELELEVLGLELEAPGLEV